MKLVTFLTASADQHIGAPGIDESTMIDLTAGNAAPHFRGMLAWIDRGSKAFDAARRLRENAKSVVLPAADRKSLAPPQGQ